MRNIHPPIPPYCFVGVSRPKSPRAGTGRSAVLGDPGEPGGAAPGVPEGALGDPEGGDPGGFIT